MALTAGVRMPFQPVGQVALHGDFESLDGGLTPSQLAAEQRCATRHTVTACTLITTSRTERRPNPLTLRGEALAVLLV